jgi:hypothetical protein
MEWDTSAYILEVLRKRGYDGTRPDLLSCGIVLYVLLYRKWIPYKGRSRGILSGINLEFFWFWCFH